MLVPTQQTATTLALEAVATRVEDEAAVAVVAEGLFSAGLSEGRWANRVRDLGGLQAPEGTTRSKGDTAGLELEDCGLYRSPIRLCL